MAQLGNLLVTGSSRLLGKLFCNDISVGNSLSVKTLSATNFTATSITTSGLTVNGNATTTGTLNVGNSQANGKISINGKVVIRDYGYNWLGINDGYVESWLTSGIFFGKSIIRTDNAFQLGNNGDKVLFNQSSAKFTVPVTINNSLAANNITATNVTVNGKLVAYQQEIRTIQDLGGEFCVSPTIYIQKASTTIVNVKKKDSTTISISIKDEKAITSSTIQGVKWAEGSKIKIQSKIDGIVIKGDGTMTKTLNTDQYTMAIDVVVDSSIANHFSTAKNNASFDEINIMLYQRYGKKIGSTTENVYSPVGIRMSATGSTNAAPYLDIWGSKSSSDPDTVYTVPSVRLGYLEGLSTTLNGISISCNGYGLYADNVYLNGTIISNSGTIGGFKLDANSLHNGTWGTDKSVLVCTGTDTAKSVGGSSTINGWCFTAGSKFGVTTSGDLYASNANISGTITSEKGKIGSFNLDSMFLQSSDETVGLSATEANWAFWAGGSTSNTAKFRVTRAGTLYTKDIQATAGKIGGWVLTSDSLYVSNKTGMSSNIGKWAFWAGETNSKNGASDSNAVFRVGHNGGVMTSSITATGGTIGGCKIENGVLKVASANITSVNASNITSGTLSADRIGANSITVGKITTENLVGTNGWINLNKGTFNYGSGKLVWDGQSLSISGNVTATSGTIGGWVINDTIQGYSKYNDNLYSIGIKNVLGASTTNQSNIYSDQGFIYSDITSKDGKTSRIIDIRANGQIHIQGSTLETGSLNGYCILGNNGIQVSSQDKKRIYIRSRVNNNNTGSSDNYNNFQLYVQNCVTRHMHIGDLSDLPNPIDLNYGIYCDKSVKFNNNIYHNDNLIGNLQESNSSTSVSCKSNTWTTLKSSLTLTPGSYIIVGTIIFNSATGGRRAVRLHNTTSNVYYPNTIIGAVANGSASYSVQTVQIIKITGTTNLTFVLEALQSTSGSVSVSNSYLRALCIS